MQIPYRNHKCCEQYRALLSAKCRDDDVVGFPVGHLGRFGMLCTTRKLVSWPLRFYYRVASFLLICVGVFLIVLEHHPSHTSQLSRSLHTLACPHASQTSVFTCNCVVKTVKRYTMDNVQKPNCSECNSIVRTQ